MNSLKLSASFRRGSKTEKISSYTRRGLKINFCRMINEDGNRYYVILKNRKQYFVSILENDCLQVLANIINTDILQTSIDYDEIDEYIDNFL